MATSSQLSQLTSSARSQVYLFLSKSFTYPDDQTFADLQSHELGIRMEMAITNLANEICELRRPWEGVQRSFYGFHSGEEIREEYSRVFQDGVSKSPCPLCERDYRDEKHDDIVAGLVQLYDHFGLQLGKSCDEEPDHMWVELCFLHHMSLAETRDGINGDSSQSFTKAEREFHELHLQIWAPVLWARIGDQDSVYFSALALLARDFLEADYEYLCKRV